MVQPTQLLQDLGMVGRVIKNPLVRGFGAVKIFLLFVNVANLEPDILLGQWPRGRVDDVFEAIKTLVEFRLLLVYYSQTEVDFIGLLKVGLDLHHLGKSFFGIIVAAVAIVQDTNSIPQHGILGVSQVHQGLLISVICLLQSLGHEVAVAKISPGFAVVLLELDNSAEELESFVESFAALEEHANSIHCGR